MGGEPLTKDQLRKYVSDGDKWIKTLGRLNPEFSNSYDDALLIGKNLNEKDVQNLYFGQLEHTTYIDITEWFIEFVELCYKVADKNIKNDFDEQFIEDVLDFVDNIKNNGRETTSGVKLIFRENSGKFIFKKLEFYKKSRKIFAQVIAPLYRYQKKRYLRGIRQGVLQGGPPRYDPSPILVGKIH